MRQCCGNGENAASPPKPAHCNWPSNALAKLNWPALTPAHASAPEVRDERLRFFSTQAIPYASSSAAHMFMVPSASRVPTSPACIRLYCGRTWARRFSCVVARSPNGARKHQPSVSHQAAISQSSVSSRSVIGHQSALARSVISHRSVIGRSSLSRQSVTNQSALSHQSATAQSSVGHRSLGRPPLNHRPLSLSLSQSLSVSLGLSRRRGRLYKGHSSSRLSFQNVVLGRHGRLYSVPETCNAGASFDFQSDRCSDEIPSMHGMLVYDVVASSSD